MVSLDRLKEFCTYNPETGDFHAISAAKGRLAGRKMGFFEPSVGYTRLWIDGKRYWAHRMAWLYMTGDMPEEIDHINGIGSDNRFVNLRNVTHAKNMINVRLRKDNSSGHKGVTFHRALQKWRARIRIDGRYISLGCYVDKSDAAKAYAAASITYHGEYARGESQ